MKRPHPETILADARSLEEYVGKEIAGHPSPWTYSLSDQCAMEWISQPRCNAERFAAIKESLEERGLHEGQEVVCYCTGGVRSGWVYFVLKIVGYHRVKNYPGSWWEWSRDFAAPTETDAKLLHKIISQDVPRPS